MTLVSGTTRDPRRIALRPLTLVGIALSPLALFGPPTNGEGAVSIVVLSVGLATLAAVHNVSARLILLLLGLILGGVYRLGVVGIVASVYCAIEFALLMRRFAADATPSAARVRVLTASRFAHLARSLLGRGAESLPHLAASVTAVTLVLASRACLRNYCRVSCTYEGANQWTTALAQRMRSPDRRRRQRRDAPFSSSPLCSSFSL